MLRSLDRKLSDYYAEPSDWLCVGGGKAPKLFFRRDGERTVSAPAGMRIEVRSVIFSRRDIDALRLACWCQAIDPKDLRKLLTETEYENLISMKLIRRHERSGAVMLTAGGLSLLKMVYGDSAIPKVSQCYRTSIILRRLRLAKLVLTAYQGNIDPFATSTSDLLQESRLFLSSLTRDRGTNPWGSTRIAAIAHLGDMICAMHYVCPGIGKLALTDELAAFSNQTAQFQDAKRVFIFAGESYSDILTELETSDPDTDSKLTSYGGAYRCLQLPVHLLSCDDTGAVQLQIMAQPDYRRHLTRAALKSEYQPSPLPTWDALFRGMPFVLAANMDLRRLDAAVAAARQEGFQKIAVAALKGQAEAVLFPRYRDTGQARVFILTDEAVAEVTGRPPVPYTPPRTQFLTEKGETVDAPPIQVHRKAGGPR